MARLQPYEEAFISSSASLHFFALPLLEAQRAVNCVAALHDASRHLLKSQASATGGTANLCKWVQQQLRVNGVP